MWYSQVPTYPTVPLHTILATFWTHDIMIWHLKCLKAPGRGQLHLSTCPPGAGAAVLLRGGAAALAGAGGGTPLLRPPRGQLLLPSRPPGAGAAVLPCRAGRPPTGRRSSRPLRSPAPARLRLPASALLARSSCIARIFSVTRGFRGPGPRLQAPIRWSRSTPTSSIWNFPRGLRQN